MEGLGEGKEWGRGVRGKGGGRSLASTLRGFNVSATARGIIPSVIKS